MGKKSIPLVLILFLAVALRFYCLDCQSLWADEGNSVALAGHGFVEIAQRTAFDIHPPLYYWLLKVWTTIFGVSEIALRSLSAALGVGVVWLVWWLGVKLFTRQVGLIAAFVAALSPLLVYYSQEARMYMLLTFLGCLTVAAMLLVLEGVSGQRSAVSGQGSGVRSQRSAVSGQRLGVRGQELEDNGRPSAVSRQFLSFILHPSSLLYLFAVTAGLYTHYAYPVILIAVNVVALLYIIRHSPFAIRLSPLWQWVMLQLIPLLLYLPWLPTAWRQLTTWPTVSPTTSFIENFLTITTTLLLGLSWPYSQAGVMFFAWTIILVIPVLFYVLRFTHHASPITHGLVLLLLYLWFGLPLLLTVYLFSPAFLKFLVVAVPPLALLTALTVAQLAMIVSRRWLGYALGGLLLLLVAGTSLISLVHYYTNPVFARDNYRSIARFIQAVAGPDDTIILNAEGQQEVFNYYYRQGQTPVYPLPRQRPLDKAVTLAELQTIAGQTNTIYAVYWATQQADPENVIEGWLNTHLYKATDQWYGNVRLVSYASPQLEVELQPVDIELGDNIRLTGYGLPNPQVEAGDILKVALQWQVDPPVNEDYTVFLQVLDAANHLAGQRDTPPLTPVSAWSVGKPVADIHGVFIEPGTPPGQYRLIVGLYHSQTGQRLPVKTQGADFVDLGAVEIVRPAAPLPLEAFDVQVPMRANLAGVVLLGYDFYKLGHRSSPATPLHPGDPVHLTAYWMRGEGEQAGKNEVTLAVVGQNGQPTGISLTGPPASTDYPPEAWQPGEIVRGQYTFFLSNLEPGQYHVVLSLPDTPEQIKIGPFWVE